MTLTKKAAAPRRVARAFATVNAVRRAAANRRRIRSATDQKNAQYYAWYARKQEAPAAAVQSAADPPTRPAAVEPQT